MAGVGGQVEICFDFISLCDEVASRGDVLLFLRLSGLNEFLTNAVNDYSVGFGLVGVGLGCGPADRLEINISGISELAQDVSLNIGIEL